MAVTVYKTEVTCTVGISIEDPSKSWDKTSFSIHCDLGPKYPEAGDLKMVASMMMHDCDEACNEHIERVARKIVDAAKRKGAQS